MRYVAVVIRVLLGLSALWLISCVDRPGGAQSPADEAEVVDSDSGMTVTRQLPEGIDESQVIKIEAQAMTPDGTGAAQAPPGSEGITGPVAKNYNAEFVEVKPFDDPDNPYRGQYTDFDRWHYDNFDPGAPFLLSGKPDERSGSLLVSDLGYAEPTLTTLRNTLKFIKGDDTPIPGFEKGLRLYARGLLSDELDEQISLAKAKLAAEYAPPIPDWLAFRPPLWALILPDGEVATYGMLGTGDGFFPEQGDWLGIVQPAPCHYSAAGRLVEQLEPGRLWCELFFKDFDKALVKHQVTRGDVLTFDRYVVFKNNTDDSLTGNYLYDGTPLTEADLATIRDSTRYFEMYGKYLPAMYAAQLELK